MLKRSFILGFVVLPAFVLGVAAGFYGIRFTAAFDGPASQAGQGAGAISSDSSNNLAIGTTTVLSDTRLFILGSTSADDKFAIQLKNKENRPLFVLRNDGRVVMGPFPIGNPPTFTTSTLQVRGLIETVNSSSPDLGGGVRFPDGTTQTTAGASTASAANISQGDFGSNVLGGNYSFPSKLSIGTTSFSGVLDVQANHNAVTDLNIRNKTAGAAATSRLVLGNDSANVAVLKYNSTANSTNPRDVELVNNDATGNIKFYFGGGHNLSLSSSSKVGIGTTNPVAKLTIGNNVATGALDTFAEYQQIFYDNVTPNISYGIGIRSNTFVFNSASAYNFDAAGVTKLTVGSDGLITATNRITGVSAPTASSDAATKGYVDGVTGAKYMGRTGTAYTGNLGGIAGANAKCNTAYAGSHMCTQGEALRTGTTTFDGAGWIACDLVHGEETCDGVTYSSTGGGEGYATCNQWAATSPYFSPVMAATGNVTLESCSVARSIHCCK